MIAMRMRKTDFKMTLMAAALGTKFIVSRLRSCKQPPERSFLSAGCDDCSTIGLYR
jgi:hypothetical protein